MSRLVCRNPVKTGYGPTREPEFPHPGEGPPPRSRPQLAQPGEGVAAAAPSSSLPGAGVAAASSSPGEGAPPAPSSSRRFRRASGPPPGPDRIWPNPRKGLHGGAAWSAGRHASMGAPRAGEPHQRASQAAGGGTAPAGSRAQVATMSRERGRSVQSITQLFFRWRAAAAGGRQQPAGSRQQAAGSRQQAPGGRQRAAGTRHQAAGSRQGPAGSRQQAAGSRQQAAGSRQQAATWCGAATEEISPPARGGIAE